MATPLDIRLVPRVKALILKYGPPAIFVNASHSYTAETSTGTISASTNRTWNITPPEPSSEAFIQNDLITSSNLVTYIAAEDIPFTPKPGMKMIFEGRTYSIESVDPIRTGILTALYQLILS